MASPLPSNQSGEAEVLPIRQHTLLVPMSSAAFGIVGLETMLTLSLSLYHDKTMSLHEVLGAMTYKAADIINVPAGRLKKGAAADLTLIDLDTSWVIDPKQFVSKSQNSPYDDWKTKGRALRTVIGGETVFVHGE